MNYSISGIYIDNFKSYALPQNIRISDLSVFLGANSSGKSTAIQSLLALKQTMECNSREIELLLSGKYVALGEFNDVIYDKSRNEFIIGLDFKSEKCNEIKWDSDCYSIRWSFSSADDKYQALLKSIDISYEDKCISFKRDSLNNYQMYVNKVLTPVIVNIQNLRCIFRLNGKPIPL